MPVEAWATEAEIGKHLRDLNGHGPGFLLGANTKLIYMGGNEHRGIRSQSDFLI
jgi:hypothetical protein